MRRILVLNGNELERKITGEILSGEFASTAEIILTGTGEEALQVLRDSSVDLFVADIQRFNVSLCNMVTMARKLAPGTPILVTSSGNQKDIANNVWRLGVHDYLLKPFRPSWLVAAAKALMQQDVTEGECAERQKVYLERLAEALRRFQYKKCTCAAREYLDLLYESTNNRGVIRMSTLAFARGVADLGASFGTAVQAKLEGCLESLRVQLERQNHKYEACSLVEKMIDVIFDAVEKNNLVDTDSSQRVLNYIDRNVRRGVSLNEAAEYVNMSSCYFSKLFKKRTGQNYIDYVTDGKIELAKRMLVDTEMSVIMIADELSYNETSYFSKAFKKKVGMTPSRYREMHQGPNNR